MSPEQIDDFFNRDPLETVTGHYSLRYFHSADDAPETSI
jgi:hypothetical protein